MDAEKKESLLLKNSGFTLIEIMVTLVIFGIISVAFVQQFNQGSRINTEQQAAVRAQQNLRIARMTMTQDVRMAGYDPKQTFNFGFEVASSTQLRITADMNGSGSVEEAGLERITYTINTDSRQLTKTLDEGSLASPTNEKTGILLRQIDPTSTWFTYFSIDESTTPPTYTQIATDPVPNDQLEDIRIVQIDLAVLEEAGRAGTVRRNATSQILCRNLGL